MTRLRVYCSCPGASATMKLRHGVAKYRQATSIVIPCSRSSESPSSSSEKSSFSSSAPWRRESAARASSWSSSSRPRSWSSRPIRVDLPSSTLPQVTKRSSALLPAPAGRASRPVSAGLVREKGQIRNSPPSSSPPCRLRYPGRSPGPAAPSCARRRSRRPPLPGSRPRSRPRRSAGSSRGFESGPSA